MVRGVADVRPPRARTVGRMKSRRIPPRTVHIHRDTYHVNVAAPAAAPAGTGPAGLPEQPAWLKPPVRNFARPYTRTQRLILALDYVRPMVHWLGVLVVFVLTRCTFASVYNWNDRK